MSLRCGTSPRSRRWPAWLPPAPGAWQAPRRGARRRARPAQPPRRSTSVEIVDYLRVARRRLWVLLGVPLAAALAVGLFIGLSPQRYTATCYVAAPALVGGAAAQQYTGTQAASQFVAAFKAAATSPRVLDQVAADTGVAAGTLRDGLAVAQVGASSQLTLAYTAAKRTTVEPVLTATARRALDFLFSSQVNIATEQVQAASADVTAATAAIADWERANKV